MDKERQPLIIELCYLATKRNEINVRRHRARWRKNYYSHALSVVEAHNGSNAKLRYLERHNANGAKQAAIDSIKSNMEWLKKKHPKPTKWLNMGLHKLRSLVLQGQGEYAMAKHQTMEFTIENRERVKYLVNELDCSIRYDNGSIVGIYFNNGLTGLNGADIQTQADKFLLDKAVEDMIQE